MSTLCWTVLANPQQVELVGGDTKPGAGRSGVAEGFVRQRVEMLRRKKATKDHELHVQKIESSGLTVEDCEELGIEFLSAGETVRLDCGAKELASIRLNYYDLDGKPMAAHPKWPPFYRIRYVEEDTSFAGQGKKQARYVQPVNSGVCPYFPQLVDWRAVAEDPGIQVFITEGEFKSAKATKEGFCCIGLGGVWNFRSGPMGQAFLPHLEEFNWIRRKVFVCYDSDFRTNPKVRHALDELAQELCDRGAMVYVLPLPDVVADGKTGLDDFLISEAGGTEALNALLNTAYPITLARSLWDFNSQVVFIKDPGLIIDQKSNQKMSPAYFKEAAYATENIMETVIDQSGEFVVRKTSLAPVWLRWPLRNQCDKLDYAPGRDKYIEEKDGTKCFNVWRGWGVEPVPGDTTPWDELIDHLFQGSEPAAKEWFLDWCAFPLQFPGVKMFSAVVIYGLTHGTGKTLIGYTLGDIYGENFVEIDQEALHDGRRDWAENRQFVLGDEITGSDKRADADMIKRLITQKKIRIDIKFVPAFELTSRINFMFTSNQPDAFFLEDTDRRYFIHEVLPSVKPLGEEFYAEYDLWRSAGGARHLLHKLLKRDVGHFNPAAPAMETKAKKRMKLDTQSDLGTWVRNLMADPDRMLRIGQIRIERDLVTNKELLRIYDPDGSKRVTANGLGRELRRAGVSMANEGLPMKTTLGTDRFYALRNAEKWAKASVKDCVAHIDSDEKQKAKRGTKI